MLMNELQLQVEALKDKFQQSYYKSIDVDEGWYQIIIDCDKELSSIDPGYSILQIKQKFGGLRYYFSSESDALDAMQEVVTKYECIAATTCEATGGRGVLMRSKSGWLKTLNIEWASSSLFHRDYTIVQLTKKEE